MYKYIKRMYTTKIQNILLEYLNLKEVYVMTYGNHYQIIVIDQILSSKKKLDQQQIIYAPLMKYITQNMIHSISIHVFCPDEWNKKRHIYKI